MSILLYYPSKKAMKEKVLGKSRHALRYNETSMFGAEVSDNCDVTGSNRPSITGVKGREFFAAISIRDGIIKGVK